MFLWMVTYHSAHGPWVIESNVLQRDVGKAEVSTMAALISVFGVGLGKERSEKSALCHMYGVHF